MRNPLARVVGHGLWYAVGNALGKAGGLLLLPILTNSAFLAPEDYGRWGVFEVTVQLGMIVFGLQLGLAVLRFYADESDREEAEAGAFWTLILVLTALGTAGAVLVLPTLDPYWGTIYGALFVYVASETLLTIPLSVLRAAGRAPAYTAMLVWRLLLVLGLIYFLLVSRQMGLTGVVVGYALASLATLLVALPLSSGRHLLRVRLNYPLIGRMLRFSVPLVLTGLGSMALNAADRYVLIALRTADEVALYTLAVKFGGVVNMFAAQPLQLALFPVLFQAAADQRAWLVQSLTRISALLFGLLAVVIVLFAEPVIILMKADPFYQQSASLVAWVAIGFGLFGIGIIFDGVLILFKKTGQTTFWFTLAAVVNILLNLAVIPWLGALGAAITTLASYGLLLGGRVWSARKLLRVAHRTNSLVGIGLTTVAICLLLPALDPGSDIMGLLIRTLLLALWGATVVLARWLDPADVRAAFRLAAEQRDGNDPRHVR